MPTSQSSPRFDHLAARAESILDAQWQPQGYTVPNASVYPHQWLWDSCFHAIVWAHVARPERALAELRNVFAHQSDDGFVPHMTYWNAPTQHEDFWGRPWTSCITQPPMYGHALAELTRLGIDVDPALVDAARAGIEFVLNRCGDDGSVVIVHPWESGCDDSPRWDSWCEPAWSQARWKQVKGDLVGAIRFDQPTGSTRLPDSSGSPRSSGSFGSPVGSNRFEVASSAFAALVAFNAIELSEVLSPAPSGRELARRGELVAAEVRARWDPARLTFVDGGSHASASVRTLEALLATLVCEARHGPDPIVDAIFGTRSAGGPEAAGVLSDPLAFGGRFGPAQVHRGEPAFDPSLYWRGGTWPQLNYLLWVAARRRGRDDVAGWLREVTIRGATRSGFSEYWDPGDGHGLGAMPQSWTTLVAVVANEGGFGRERS